MVLPEDWKRPELWLARRLRRGEISGYKVGHQWRMTQADVDDLIGRHRNIHNERGTRPSSLVTDGLTARAARRRLKTARRP